MFNAGHRKPSEVNGVLALNDTGFSQRGDQVNSDGRVSIRQGGAEPSCKRLGWDSRCRCGLQGPEERNGAAA